MLDWMETDEFLVLCICVALWGMMVGMITGACIP